MIRTHCLSPITLALTAPPRGRAGPVRHRLQREPVARADADGDPGNQLSRCRGSDGEVGEEPSHTRPRPRSPLSPPAKERMSARPRSSHRRASTSRSASPAAQGENRGRDDRGGELRGLAGRSRRQTSPSPASRSFTAAAGQSSCPWASPGTCRRRGGVLLVYGQGAADARPGIYQGEVAVTSSSRKIGAISIVLEVLPIKLGNPALRPGLQLLQSQGQQGLASPAGRHAGPRHDHGGRLVQLSSPGLRQRHLRAGQFLEAYKKAGYPAAFYFAPPWIWN